MISFYKNNNKRDRTFGTKRAWSNTINMLNRAFISNGTCILLLDLIHPPLLLLGRPPSVVELNDTQPTIFTIYAKNIHFLKSNLTQLLLLKLINHFLSNQYSSKNFVCYYSISSKMIDKFLSERWQKNQMVIS